MKDTENLDSAADSAAEATQPAGRDCPPVADSRLVLQQRFDDREKGWLEWKDIEGHILRDKYGTTVDEWMVACRAWIVMGGRYQYRLIRRADTVEWEMDYSENA